MSLVGADYLLKGRDCDVDMTSTMTLAVLYLDSHARANDDSTSSEIVFMFRDFVEGCKRTAVRFLSKRVKCTYKNHSHSPTLEGVRVVK